MPRQVCRQRHEDQRLRPEVVGGPVGELVAQVGRETLCHGGRVQRPRLPLQEEGPRLATEVYDAERIGVEGVLCPPC